jgi:hypothetical protein
LALYTHTHTHTSTFREIRRVANEAALFGVEDRLFVALYEEKNKVLEIACFLSSRKIISVKLFFVEINYADYKEFLCNSHCLEILAMCFLRGILKKIILKKCYTYVRSVSNLAEIGGVE